MKLFFLKPLFFSFDHDQSKRFASLESQACLYHAFNLTEFLLRAFNTVGLAICDLWMQKHMAT